MLKPLTDENFNQEVRENTDPIVIMFTGSWCPPCKRMKPVFEDMANQMQGNIRFAEMDIVQSEETANELGIRSVPSLVLFVDGMMREIHSGTMQKNELRLWIQENI